MHTEAPSWGLLGGFLSQPILLTVLQDSSSRLGRYAKLPLTLKMLPSGKTVSAQVCLGVVDQQTSWASPGYRARQSCRASQEIGAELLC